LNMKSKRLSEQYSDDGGNVDDSGGQPQNQIS